MLFNLRIYKELREQRVREQLAAEDAKIPAIPGVAKGCVFQSSRPSLLPVSLSPQRFQPA